jgi:6-phosphogluconolactonase
VAADAGELARLAAEWLTARIEAVLGERPVCRVALAGGSTPRATYRRLADPGEPWCGRLDWQRLELFFGDERFVPVTHQDSNYRMVSEELLSKVPIPPSMVHRVPTEMATPAAAAAAYQTALVAAFGKAPPAWPDLDVVLLGMGADGHTASLFPENTEALGEQRRWVVASLVEKLGAARISLTLPVFNHARAVVFLVGGGEKAETVARVLGKRGPCDLPAARVRPAGDLVWLVDRAAAAAL